MILTCVLLSGYPILGLVLAHYYRKARKYQTLYETEERVSQISYLRGKQEAFDWVTKCTTTVLL